MSTVGQADVSPRILTTSISFFLFTSLSKFDLVKLQSLDWTVLGVQSQI